MRACNLDLHSKLYSYDKQNHNRSPQIAYHVTVRHPFSRWFFGQRNVIRETRPKAQLGIVARDIRKSSPIVRILAVEQFESRRVLRGGFVSDRVRVNIAYSMTSAQVQQWQCLRFDYATLKILSFL